MDDDNVFQATKFCKQIDLIFCQHSHIGGLSLFEFYKVLDRSSYFKSIYGEDEVLRAHLQKLAWDMHISKQLKLTYEAMVQGASRMQVETSGVGFMAVREDVHVEAELLEVPFSLLSEDKATRISCSQASMNRFWGYYESEYDELGTQVQELLHYLGMAGPDGYTKHELKAKVRNVNYLNKAMAKVQNLGLAFSFRPPLSRTFKYALTIHKVRIMEDMSKYHESNLVGEFIEVFFTATKVLGIDEMMYHDVFELLKSLGKNKIKQLIGKDINYYTFRDLMFRYQLRKGKSSKVLLVQEKRKDTEENRNLSKSKRLIDYWVVRKNRFIEAVKEKPFEEEEEDPEALKYCLRKARVTFSRTEHDRLLGLLISKGKKGLKLSDIAYGFGFVAKDSLYTKRLETTLLTLAKSKVFVINKEKGKQRGRIVSYVPQGDISTITLASTFLKLEKMYDFTARNKRLAPPMRKEETGDDMRKHRSLAFPYRPEDKHVLLAMKEEFDQPIRRIKSWTALLDLANDDPRKKQELTSFFIEKLRAGYENDMFSLVKREIIEGEMDPNSMDLVQQDDLVPKRGKESSIQATQAKEDIKRLYSGKAYMEIIQTFHEMLYCFETTLPQGNKIVLNEFESWLPLQEYLILASKFHYKNPAKLLEDVEKKKKFADVRSEHGFYARTARIKFHTYMQTLKSHGFAIETEPSISQQFSLTITGLCGRKKKKRLAYDLVSPVRLPRIIEEYDSRRLDDFLKTGQVESDILHISSLQDIKRIYLEAHHWSQFLHRYGLDGKCFRDAIEIQSCPHKPGTCPYSLLAWKTKVDKVLKGTSKRHYQKHTSISLPEVDVPLNPDLPNLDIEEDLVQGSLTPESNRKIKRKAAELAEELAGSFFDLERFRSNYNNPSTGELDPDLITHVALALRAIRAEDFYYPAATEENALTGPKAPKTQFLRLLTQQRVLLLIFTKGKENISDSTLRRAIVGYEAYYNLLSACLLSIGCQDKCKLPNIFDNSIETCLRVTSMRNSFALTMKDEYSKTASALESEGWEKELKRKIESAQAKRTKLVQQLETDRIAEKEKISSSRRMKNLAINKKSKMHEELNTMASSGEQLPEMLKTRRGASLIQETPDDVAPTKRTRSRRKVSISSEKQDAKRVKRVIHDQKYFADVEKRFYAAGEVGLREDAKLKAFNYEPMIKNGTLVRTPFYDHYRIIHYKRGVRWLLFPKGNVEEIQASFKIRKTSAGNEDQDSDTGGEMDVENEDEQTEEESVSAIGKDFAAGKENQFDYVVPRLWTNIDGSENVELKETFKKLILSYVFQHPGCSLRRLERALLKYMYPIDVETLLNEVTKKKKLIEKIVISTEDEKGGILLEPRIAAKKEWKRIFSG
eukprot:snap_masked-scaffold_1-processed-gene-26.38-mRNA-1 protein AED:1.00 eAED:1.00 QI:0/-1/0/0/-1/1/1/0/1369